MTAGPSGPVRAVLFDVDDTLIDTRTAIRRAGNLAAARLWPDGDAERLAGAGARYHVDPGGHFRAYTRGELDFDAMRAARFADLATWVTGDPAAAHEGSFRADFEAALLTGLRPYADARPCIDALQTAGLAVGLLTNASGALTHVKLAHTGLADVTAVVCTRDTLGFGKPDARAFHEACRQLGSDPAHTLHIGDELAADPLGALDAGLRAAWLVRDGVVASSDRALAADRELPIIDDLAAVPGLVAAIAGDFGGSPATG